MPAEHPLAKKTALSAENLTANLKVFRHPSQHPEAHEVLLELLAELGVDFEANSHFSHPHDISNQSRADSGLL